MDITLTYDLTENLQNVKRLHSGHELACAQQLIRTKLKPPQNKLTYGIANHPFQWKTITGHQVPNYPTTSPEPSNMTW